MDYHHSILCKFERIFDRVWSIKVFVQYVSNCEAFIKNFKTKTTFHNEDTKAIMEYQRTMSPQKTERHESDDVNYSFHFISSILGKVQWFQFVWKTLRRH